MAKMTKWYLWIRYGHGHIRYLDEKKLSEENAEKWARQQLKKLMETNRISECYISTGRSYDYRKVEIYKNFYWIK